MQRSSAEVVYSDRIHDARFVPASVRRFRQLTLQVSVDQSVQIHHAIQGLYAH